MSRLASGARDLRAHAERAGTAHQVEDPLKVRVGLGLGAVLAAEDLFTVADAAEETGLDSLWFSERVTGDQLAPLSVMAAVAARTRRVRFGSSALILPGRNPLRLAKEVATIDRLSGGRMIPVFGLVSAERGERALLPVPHGAAGRWADEALSVMRRLWAGETIEHHGEFFTYSGVRVGPRTSTLGPLDVWTGGHSPPAIVRAGRLADGWLPSALPAERYHALARDVLDAAGAAGRSWDLGHFGMVVPYVPRGREGAAQPVLAARAERLRRTSTSVPDAASLHAHLLEYVAAGASKFVAVPVVAPEDWAEEIGWLQHAVAAPLREVEVRV